MDSTDELYSLATEARSQIRSALTPEQRERWDTGFRHDRPERNEAPGKEQEDTTGKSDNGKD